MAIINPVAQTPFGAALTNVALSSLSVQYMQDNCVVQTLGATGVDDGYAGIYTFSGACAVAADGFNVLVTPTTGRWINCATRTPASVNLTGDVTGAGGTTVIVAPNGLPVTAISKKATDATACPSPST